MVVPIVKLTEFSVFNIDRSVGGGPFQSRVDLFGIIIVKWIIVVKVFFELLHINYTSESSIFLIFGVWIFSDRNGHPVLSLFVVKSTIFVPIHCFMCLIHLHLQQMHLSDVKLAGLDRNIAVSFVVGEGNGGGTVL